MNRGFFTVVDSMYIETYDANPTAKVDWIQDLVDRKTGLLTVKGNLHNLRINDREDGRLTISGSIPKYLLGSNVHTLNYSDLTSAISQLSCDLGIDPTFAKVLKMDLAATLEMPRCASTYYSVFGNLSRFAKEQYKNGIIYRSKVRSFAIYDKGKEARIDQDNLLRMEVNLRRIKYHFGQTLFLSDLENPDIFTRLVEKWYRYYQAIQKIRRTSLVKPSSMKDLRNQVAGIGIESLGGQEYLLQQINRWDLNENNHRSCTKFVKDVCGSGNSEVDDQLIKELDQAVDQQREVLLSEVQVTETSGGGVNL